MDKRQIKEIAHTLAVLILNTVSWGKNEPLDDFDTEKLANEFRKQLDTYMGNE